jgi:hypothetical protein
MARTKKANNELAGTVEVKMINPKRTGTITLRDYHDSTGMVVELKDQHGNPRTVKYTRAVKYLNLDNPDDKLEYLHLKDHPLYVKGSKPLIKLVNHVQEAIGNIDKQEAALEAKYEVKNMTSSKAKAFARVLGINVNNVDDRVVKSKLYDFADNNSDKFMEAFNDPDRELKELAHRGKEKGIFTVKRTGAWYYRDQSMGTNIDNVVIWFKDNEDLLPNIRKELHS